MKFTDTTEELIEEEFFSTFFTLINHSKYEHLKKPVFSKDSVRKNRHSEKEMDNHEIQESFANAMHDHSVLPYDMA